MNSIRQIVQQVLKTSDLTIEAEEQLRLLLQTTRYSQEDINEFMRLQLAVMTGLVRQQSRELRTKMKIAVDINKYTPSIALLLFLNPSQLILRYFGDRLA
jgi:hypothetical protein